MATFREYADYDGVGLGALVRSGQVSAVDVVEAAIEAIEAHNPSLAAVVTTQHDRARAAARGIDSNRASDGDGPRLGPLAGAPFLLKDIGATSAGLPITFGSRFFGRIEPEHDWAYTGRLKHAGAIIMGTSKTCELGLSVTCEPALQGPTYNPWNRQKTPGGSSGGSGAAVAARMVPIAYGGDAFGSIRAPASCCGVVGLKPSRGLLSHGPDVGTIMSGLVVIGFLSRSVRDQAACIDAVYGPCPGDPYTTTNPVPSFSEALATPPRPLRIALCYHMGQDGTGSRTTMRIDPACKRALMHTAKLCRDLGHHVEEASPALDLDLVQQVFRTCMSVDTALALQAHPQTGHPARREDVERVTWATAQRGLAVSAVELAKAQSDMEAIGRHMADFHGKYDILLTSTLATPPVDLGWLDMMLDDVDEYWHRVAAFAPYCVPFNASGQPAISVPLGRTNGGLPIGVQLSAAFAGDALLLQLAAQLEQAAPWDHLRPPLATT